MDGMKVTAGEVAKHFGAFADRALVEPVTITKYGREHLVLISAEEYARLKQRDRKVYRVGEIPDDIIDAIAKAEPGAESEALQKRIDEQDRGR
ncbi:MAG: type II toxin-antitoxin system prevent-host-death family antitoxin [Hyphomicrobiales bacterium]